jgi:hypothetical protein
LTWFTKYGDGNSPAIIQAEDGEHYSTYPTVANNFQAGIDNLPGQSVSFHCFPLLATHHPSTAGQRN